MAKAPRQKRQALALLQRHSWRTYRHRIAQELEKLGAGKQASALRECGELVSVWDCGDCGRKAIRATATVTCKSRACPHCSRVLAAARVERLTRAALSVPDSFAAQSPAIRAELGRIYHRACDAVAYWQAAAKGQTDAGKPVSAGIARRLANAETARRAARWPYARAKDPQWNWKLITIAPQWNPSDPDELTVAALQKRVDEIWAMWRAIWARVGIGGLGAAMVSIEISRGFVHAHALVWSPWLEQTHLVALAQSASARAVHVDIREAAATDDPKTRGMSISQRVKHAVKEAVKYAAKAPSPRLDWVSGERRPVQHPELVARWSIAMRSRQLGRVYGLARRPDLDASKDELSPRHACPTCEGQTLDIRVLSAEKAARELLRVRARALARAQAGDGPCDYFATAIDWHLTVNGP